MAWETRHVKIPALNDSQYIGISVYSAVITSVSVVVLANLLSERVTLVFIIITSIILTSTTATLCLVFLPKMNDIWNKGKDPWDIYHDLVLNQTRLEDFFHVRTKGESEEAKLFVLEIEHVF